MTDKERLEEVKTRFNAMNELDSFKKLAPTELFFNDLDWLIEQAERVQDLKIMLKVLGKRNQRYKQALEKIVNQAGINKEIDLELWKMAREALEGEK